MNNFIWLHYSADDCVSLTGKLMSRRRGLLTAENAVMEHLVSERHCRAGHCERQDRSTGELLL